ncbi:MAG: 16S rRNA (uracil(1498)-N(3))-methyltransferase [Clostridia bacterium]|nr:16S rRNA (uracil(1498)-N(3))-methyltransferase [Clostridia bacterium]
MPRFFVTASQITADENGTVITVTGDDAAHITRVLRMKPGEHVTVCDENGTEYETTVRETGQSVTLDVHSSRMSENEPPYRVTVYQALVKGDRFDTVLQKATELGAVQFVPVITSRCTVKLEKSDYRKKTERWQRIVYEAAKQCGRAVIPTVREPILLRDAVTEAALCDLPLFCYEAGGTKPLPGLFDEVPSPKTAAVMIGPEGGFEEEEAALAKEHGMKLTGLGRRILRTETAAPFVLSCLSCRYEL